MKIKYAQTYIIVFSVLVLIFIGYLSVELIRETPNREVLDLDFTANANQISAFGSLIGGILSFLSVLFVLYNVLEVRGQIAKEKAAKESENEESSINRLIMVSNALKVNAAEIAEQGDRMIEFVTNETLNPTLINKMVWNTNRHFGRLMNMDFELMFTTFQKIYGNERTWHKELMNLYRLNDFYGDTLADLKDKNKLHMEIKGAMLVETTDKITYLLDITTEYLANAQMLNPTFYMKEDMCIALNSFVGNYYDYIEQHKNEPNWNFEEISDTILRPFAIKLDELRNAKGLNTKQYEILATIARTRKYIRKVIGQSEAYYEDISNYYLTYFSKDSKTLLEYMSVSESLDKVLLERLGGKK